MARDAREIMSREIMGISMKSAGRYIAIHIWLWPGLGLEIMGREKHEIILGRATCHTSPTDPPDHRQRQTPHIASL